MDPSHIQGVPASSTVQPDSSSPDSQATVISPPLDLGKAIEALTKAISGLETTFTKEFGGMRKEMNEQLGGLRKEMDDRFGHVEKYLSELAMKIDSPLHTEQRPRTLSPTSSSSDTSLFETTNQEGKTGTTAKGRPTKTQSSGGSPTSEDVEESKGEEKQDVQSPAQQTDEARDPETENASLSSDNALLNAHVYESRSSRSSEGSLNASLQTTVADVEERFIPLQDVSASQTDRSEHEESKSVQDSGAPGETAEIDTREDSSHPEAIVQTTRVSGSGSQAGDEETLEERK